MTPSKNINDAENTVERNWDNHLEGYIRAQTLALIAIAKLLAELVSRDE